MNGGKAEAYQYFFSASLPPWPPFPARPAALALRLASTSRRFLFVKSVDHLALSSVEMFGRFSCGGSITELPALRFWPADAAAAAEEAVAVAAAVEGWIFFQELFEMMGFAAERLEAKELEPFDADIRLDADGSSRLAGAAAFASSCRDRSVE